jgi:hypothetical protein
MLIRVETTVHCARRRRQPVGFVLDDSAISYKSMKKKLLKIVINGFTLRMRFVPLLASALPPWPLVV